MNYETFLQHLLILSNEINSPIFKNMNKCFLKSPKDTLFLIGKYITSYDFKKIEKRYLNQTLHSNMPNIINVPQN